MTLSAISNSESYEKITKTVYLNDSKKYYRKLDNVTLRVKIHGEDSVTAKDIWLDALTCESDWLFTTSNIAKRWNLPLKTTRKKMTLLSNSGLARHEKITDPKDGKILMHVWLFFETPQPPKPGHWVFDGTCKQNKVISEKPTAPEKGVVYHYKNKQQKEKTTTTTPPKSPPEPPPSPPPETPPQSSVVVSSLRSKIAPEKQRLVSDKTITSALETFTEKQIEILIAQVNDPKKDIINPGGYIAKACKEKWNIPEEQAASIELTPQQRLEKNIAENKKNDQLQDNLEADGRASLEEIRALRAKNYKTKSSFSKIDKFADNREVGLNEDKVVAAKALAQMIIAGNGSFGNDI